MTEPSFTGAPWTTEPGALVFLEEPPISDGVGMTFDEAFDFLSGNTDVIEVLTAAADVHEGAMIAFIPTTDDLVELVLSDGEPLEQLHTTAFYLGDNADIPEDVKRLIHVAIKDIAMLQPVIVGDVFGFSVWNPNTDHECAVADVGGADLEDAHESIFDVLDDMGFPYPDQHDPWRPHITLKYQSNAVEVLTDEVMAKTGPITYDRIRVAFGGVVTDYPLGGVLIASEAFHLAGKHNQQSHAHGTGGIETVSGRELKDSKKNFDRRQGGATRKGGALSQATAGDETTQTAVADYAGSVGYYDVNQGLRNAHGNLDEVVLPPPRNIKGRPSPFEDNEHLRSTIGAMDAGMASHHTTEDIVVHRVIENPARVFGSHFDRRNEGPDNEGLTWTEHGFVSTTTDGSRGMSLQRMRLRGGQGVEYPSVETVSMKILVPAGSHALRGRTEVEQELILDRGSKFRIVNDYGYNFDEATWDVDVELLP